MVKFLKFVLFLVVIAFSFALGVKFSDSFKGHISASDNGQISVEKEMNDAFDGAPVETQEIVEIQDVAPVTEQEKQDIENAIVPNYVDMEVVEKQPMDNIDEIEMGIVPDVNNTNIPENPSAPVPMPELPDSSINPGTAPIAPAVPQDPTMPNVPSPTPIAPQPTPPAPTPQPIPAQPAQPTPAQSASTQGTAPASNARQF